MPVPGWSVSRGSASQRSTRWECGAGLAFGGPLLALAVVACGDSENERRGASPRISDLSYDPVVVEIGQPTQVYGSVQFDDADGDVTELRVSVTTPEGTVIDDSTKTLRAFDDPFPEYQGNASFTANFTPLEVGVYQVDAFVVDSGGNSSNHLIGDVAARVPQICTPGSQVSCSCANGVQGYQICADDGSKLGTCFGCPGGPEPEPDGGATDGCATVGSIPALGYEVVDAEYSPPLERIVLVSKSPSALHVLDPVTGAEQSVALPTVPTAVSVGPDGVHAAVGHDGYVSHVDLQTRSVVATWPVTTDAIDVVLAGNGYAYVFPRADQWEQIRSVQLSNGTETTSGASSIYAGTVAKLAPGKLALYGANRGLSPSDLERYDIADGTAQVGYDSPYHGDHEMCGDLWLAEDGSRIFTRCGNVFRASDVQADDMTYAGALSDLTWVVHLSHSRETNVVVAVGGTRSYGASGDVASEDSEVRVYTGDFYNPAPNIPLPCVIVAGEGRVGHGRFVFVRSDGSEYYAVVGADNSASPAVDFGVARLAP